MLTKAGEVPCKTRRFCYHLHVDYSKIITIEPGKRIREIGLRDADDVVIWEYAKAHGFAVVSKDSDFQQRSLLLGAPPKFIWLRVGNCTVATTEILLRRHSAAIHTFNLDDTKSHLILP